MDPTSLSRLLGVRCSRLFGVSRPGAGLAGVLVLSFFSAACVWMLLRAEFLAIALCCRVGRVVLFPVVVMMLASTSARCASASGTSVAAVGGVFTLSRWRGGSCPGAHRRAGTPAAALQLGNTSCSLEVTPATSTRCRSPRWRSSRSSPRSRCARARNDSKRTTLEQIRRRMATACGCLDDAEDAHRDVGSDAAAPGDREEVPAPGRSRAGPTPSDVGRRTLRRGPR